MISNPTECRKFATKYKAQSRELGISTKRATLLKNIAQSLSGLASQLDMLIEDTPRIGAPAMRDE